MGKAFARRRGGSWLARFLFCFRASLPGLGVRSREPEGLLVCSLYDPGEFFDPFIGWLLRLAVPGLRRRHNCIRVSHRRHAGHREQPPACSHPLARSWKAFLSHRAHSCPQKVEQFGVSPPECPDRPVSPVFPDRGSAPRSRPWANAKGIPSWAAPRGLPRLCCPSVERCPPCR